MKTALTALIASLLMAGAGLTAAQSSAQSQPQSAAPSSSSPLPPQRPQPGATSGLNLKLDDSARRSIATSAPDEKAPSAASALPGLGAGARPMEPAGGFGRPKSDAKTYPKSTEY